MVSGNLDGSQVSQGGAVVFDLQDNTYRLFHPHEPSGGEAGFLPSVWSPNGNLLVVFDHSMSQPGGWVMHTDGSIEMLAYSPGALRGVLGLQVVWSPDARRHIY